MSIMYRFYCTNNQIGDDYLKYIEIYRQRASFFLSSTIILWHLAQKSKTKKNAQKMMMERKHGEERHKVNQRKRMMERGNEKEKQSAVSSFSSHAGVH